MGNSLRREEKQGKAGARAGANKEEKKEGLDKRVTRWAGAKEGEQTKGLGQEFKEGKETRKERGIVKKSI